MWEWIDIWVALGDELWGGGEDPAPWVHPKGAGSRNPASAAGGSGAIPGRINVG